MKKIINVTYKHFADGIIGNPSSCPVFLAMKDAELPVRSVGNGFVSLEDDRLIELPTVASKLIRKFDAGEPCSPILFEVEVPETKPVVKPKQPGWFLKSAGGRYFHQSSRREETASSVEARELAEQLRTARRTLGSQLYWHKTSQDLAFERVFGELAKLIAEALAYADMMEEYEKQ